MGALANIWFKQPDAGGVDIDGINFIFLAEKYASACTTYTNDPCYAGHNCNTVFESHGIL